MFRICNKHVVFESSAQENWMSDKDLNPLCVNRLGYRDSTSLILDFIRAGDLLVLSREAGFSKGYLNENADSIVGDYFEEISPDLDNLHNVHERIISLNKSKLSTTFPPEKATGGDPLNEPPDANSVDSGGKAVENLEEEK